MYVSRKMLAVFMGIMLAVSIPLQCSAESTNENTDFSMISKESTLSKNILAKWEWDTDIIMGEGASGTQITSEKVYVREDENEIKSFATHTHTKDCYAGHRHVQPHGTMNMNNVPVTIRREGSGTLWKDDGSNSLGYYRDGITVRCAVCGDELYSVYISPEYGTTEPIYIYSRAYVYTGTTYHQKSTITTKTTVPGITNGGDYYSSAKYKATSSFNNMATYGDTYVNMAFPWQGFPIWNSNGNMGYLPFTGCTNDNSERHLNPDACYSAGKMSKLRITHAAVYPTNDFISYSDQSGVINISCADCNKPIVSFQLRASSEFSPQPVTNGDIDDRISTQISCTFVGYDTNGSIKTYSDGYSVDLSSRNAQQCAYFKQINDKAWNLLSLIESVKGKKDLVIDYPFQGVLVKRYYELNNLMGWAKYRGCPYCGTFGSNYSCGEVQDNTLDCNLVVTSITPTNPTQTIKRGENIITTATATFLDGHTGVVDCTSNLNSTLEGTRTVTLTYSGAIDNAKTPGTKTCNITVTVDNTSPVINSVGVNNSLNSISLNVSATDTVSLAANPYKYTIGTGSGAGFRALLDTGWLSSSSYQFSSLTPNTAYSYIVQVRDNVGYTSTPYERTTYTKVDKPSATIAPIDGKSIKINIADANPASTLYSIRVGDQYATNSGVLSQVRSEYTLSTKQLVVTGLQGSKKYDITVSAKETGSGQFISGNIVSFTTTPDIPVNLSAGTITNSNISLNWDKTSGALSYELLREILSPEGIVIGSKNINDIVTNNYMDTNLTANQTYRYKVRCKDQYSQYSAWSNPLTVKTIPMPPEKVVGLKAGVVGKTLNISWNPAQGAIGYEVAFISNGTPKNIFVTGTSCTIEADQYDSQCSIKVRAYNLRLESDPTNSSKWSNSGTWSDEYMCYTYANMPVFKDIQVTTNSANVTWDANGNPHSVRYVLGIFVMDSLLKEITLTDDNTGDDQLTCNVTGLLPNTDYLFKIKAINSVNEETSWSEGIARKTQEEAPEVPDGLLISSSGSRINLAWNMSERTKNYEVKRNDVVIATGLTDHNYVDKEVVADQDYTYAVRAVNETGNSEWSIAISARLGVKPIAPQVSVVTGSSISVSLEWTPIEDSTGYDIEVDNQKYTTTSDTSYEHTGLIPGEEHTYRVRARNSNGYSAWSEPVTAMTTPVTPGIPCNISAVPSDNQILIRWEPVLDVTSYDVEIDSEVYYDIQASEYLYPIMGGKAEDSICRIRVRSVNKGYIGEWSEIIEAIATGGSELPVIQVPATPSITGSVNGASIISISWDKIDGSSKYQLEADGVVLYTGTNTTYIHRGLKEMNQYHYRVRAGNISGYSEWSSPFEATTTTSNNTTPRNLTYYREDSTSTAIIWDSSSSVSNYRIEVNSVLLDEEITSTKISIPTIPDKQYRIRVAALTEEGENTVYDWSDEMIFNAPSNLPGIPVIKDKSATSDKITLSWNEVIGANGYDIDIDGQIINVNNKLTFTITNLNATTSYTIKVRAYNSSGKGSWSEVSTIMTNEGIPTGAPINITVQPIVTASVVSGCAIRINWNAVDRATSYEVDDQSGTIYTSNTDEIIIDSLQPGILYYFKVRALTSAGPGPWSSRISFVPIVTVPENIKITLENDMVHMSWNDVGGAKTYEIEIDGVVFKTTTNTEVDFAYKTFYAQRAVRVRACNDTLKSEWSEVIFYNQPLPKSINVIDNEEFSVILPVKNVNMNMYKFTLTFNSEELELLDAYEMTPKTEKGTTYLKELGVYIIRSNIDNFVSMTFVVEDDKKTNWSGIVSSMRFKSNKTGNVTLKYGVTLK